MGLVGRLEDIALPEIFQILSLSKKTGRLTLTRREGNGVIVFRGGKIIYAASDSVRDTLGNILVCEKLITESTLLAALEAQHRSLDGKRLGSILVEMGYLTRETLEKVIRQQIEKVIYEFLTWRTGFFKFDLMEIPQDEDIEVDAKDFLVQGGLSTEYVVLEGLRKLDEMENERKAQQHGTAPSREPPRGGGRRETPAASTPPPRALTSLKSILAEIRSPSFTGEITLMIMRYAAEIVNRGVLFLVRRDGISGVGQFGIHLQGVSADDRVRSLKIPVDQPSVLLEVIEKQQSYRGKLEKTFWNDHLVQQLGGQTPSEVIAIPMTVNGPVIVVFYGDNLPGDAPIGEIEVLELLMIQAGLAMEKTLLEMKTRREVHGSRPAEPGP